MTTLKIMKKKNGELRRNFFFSRRRWNSPTTARTEGPARGPTVVKACRTSDGTVWPFVTMPTVVCRCPVALDDAGRQTSVPDARQRRTASGNGRTGLADAGGTVRQRRRGPFGNADWPLKLHTHAHTDQPGMMPTCHRQPQSSSMQPPPVFSLTHPSPLSVFSKKKFLSPKSSKLFSLFFYHRHLFVKSPRSCPPRGALRRNVERPHQGRDRRVALRSHPVAERSRNSRARPPPPPPWSAGRLVVGVPMLKDRGAALGRCGMSGSATVSSPHRMTLGRRRSEGWAVAAWAGGRATALTCHPRRQTSPSAPSSSRRSPRRSP